jgi:long-subunit fatty acid transport protein
MFEQISLCRLSIVFLFILGLAFGVSAQDASYYIASFDYIPQDFGTMSYSAGGCFTSNTRGAESVFSNPAGIALTEEKDIQVLYTGDVDILGKPPQLEDDFYEEVRDWEDFSYKRSLRLNPLKNLSVMGTYTGEEMPVTFGGGVALRSYYDLGYKNSESYTADDVDYELEQSVSGGLNFLTLSGALSYQNKYSGGISFGIPMMSKVSGSTTEEISGLEENYEEEVNFNIAGSYMRIGVIAEIIEGLSVGFTYTGGQTIELEDGEYDVNDFEGEHYSGDLDDVEIEIPGYISFGLSYDIIPQLTVTGEYQSRPWEDYEEEESGANIFDNDMENGYSLRAGIIYNTGSLQLKAGYMLQKGPLVQYDEDGEYDELVGINTITGGIGWKAGKIGVDLGLGYSMYKYEQWIGDTDYEGSSNLVEVLLSITYGFPAPYYK